MRIAVLGDPIDQQSAGIHVFTREMVKAMIRCNPGHELFITRERNDDTFDDGIEQIVVPVASNFPGACVEEVLLCPGET